MSPNSDFLTLSKLTEEGKKKMDHWHPFESFFLPSLVFTKFRWPDEKFIKADRVMAGCLPFGKYPLLNVEVITGLAISVSVFSFFVSGLVTALYKVAFNNYVDQILHPFWPPTHFIVDITLNVDMNGHFLDHLPTLSCPRSYWMPSTSPIMNLQ